MSAPTKRPTGSPTRMYAARGPSAVRPSPCDPELTAHCPSELLAGLLAAERAQPSCPTTAVYEQTRLDLDMAARVAVDAFAVQGTPRPSQRPPLQPARRARPPADAATVVTAKLESAPRSPKHVVAPRAKPTRATKLIITTALLAGACSLAILACIAWTSPHARAPGRPASAGALVHTGNRVPAMAAGTASALAPIASVSGQSRDGHATSGSTHPVTLAQAADSLARGELAQAARAYQVVARTRLGDRVFEFIARALQHHVAAQCAQRAAAGGEPCNAG